MQHRLRVIRLLRDAIEGGHARSLIRPLVEMENGLACSMHSTASITRTVWSPWAVTETQSERTPTMLLGRGDGLDARGYSKKAKGGSGKHGKSGKANREEELARSGGEAGDVEEFDIEEYRVMMRKSVEHLQHELANIRMGRATPGMLDHLHVVAYGEKLPMKAVGTVTVKSSQLLAVTCFDPNLADSVAKCIEESPLRLRAQVEKDGQLLVPIPAPTHETIDAMLKLCKGEAEAAKVSIRNARKLANAATRSLQSKDETFAATQRIQKLTDDFIGEVEGILKQKAADIGDI